MNDIAFCRFAIVPMRADASEKSEQVSQLLFGEWAEIQTKKSGWLFVQTLEDEYQGWVNEKSLLPARFSEYEEWEKATKSYVAEKYGIAKSHFSGYTRTVLLPLGTTLPQEPFAIADHLFHTETPLQSYTENHRVEDLLEMALQYQGTPYLWGGRTLAGIDCSGFVQRVFRHVQIALPRDAYQQATIGEAISSMEESQAGDVAFFHTNGSKITHTGILLGNNRIIHASGDVHIDTMDNLGIFCSENNHYTHYLSTIRRIYEPIR